MGAAISLLMLVILILKYVAIVASGSGFGNSSPSQESSDEILQRIINIFISAITLVVVAVPEGLPLAVTLALAYATSRMLQDNNLVRVLSACETMGNATTVCSDKTGTLTQNRMTVVKGVFGKNFLFEGDEDIKKLSTRLSQLPDLSPGGPSNAISGAELFNRICEGIAINSSVFEGVDETTGKKGFMGSKTETALIEFLVKTGSDYLAIRNNPDTTVEQLFPFSSERKSMGIILKLKDKNGKISYRFHIKGASEIVLRYCHQAIALPSNQSNPTSGSSTSHSSVYSPPRTGNVSPPPPRPPLSHPTVIPLDTRTTSEITNMINRYAEQSLRTICVAYREISAEDYEGKIVPLLRSKVAEFRYNEQLEHQRRDDPEYGLIGDQQQLPSQQLQQQGHSLSQQSSQLPSPRDNSGELSQEDRERDIKAIEAELTDGEIFAHPLAYAEIVKRNLILMGLFGIEDPLRPGVSEAVKACQKAGVTVRMVIFISFLQLFISFFFRCI